jgi:hypothetical protein
MTKNRQQAICKVLKARYVGPGNRIVIWPFWLNFKTINELEKSGMIINQFYRHLYGHTDYFVN